MRIGWMTGMLVGLQLPANASGFAFGMMFLIGMVGGMALSSKLDALARKGGEG
jgi:hypothetical protein